MKSLLLSLTVLTMLVSCGKDNKTNSGAAVGAGSSAITLNVQAATSLGNMINSSESYFAPAPNAASGLKYYYSTGVAASNNGCTPHTTGGWIKFTYYTCSNTSTSNQGNQTSVYVASVDLQTKRNEIAAIINSSTAGAISQTSSTAYVVRTTSGAVYLIDRNYPIQANPVQVQQVGGQMTTYLGTGY